MTERDRRGFLTGASAVLAAAPLVHGASGGPLKLGIIGCGGRGTGAANHAMHTGEDVHLVAACDVDRETLGAADGVAPGEVGEVAAADAGP